MDEVITLEQAKLNLKVDFGDDDDIITANILAAQDHVQNTTGLVLSVTDITETQSRLAPSIELEAWPVRQIKEVRCTQPDGTMVALPASAWRANLNHRPVRIYPVAFNWGLPPVECFHHHHERSALPVEIDIEAGYETDTDIPPAVKQALFLLIAHFYANRKAVEVGARAAAVTVPLGVDALLERFILERV